MLFNSNERDYEIYHSVVVSDPFINGLTVRWEAGDEPGAPLVKEFFERKRDKEKIENEYGFK